MMKKYRVKSRWVGYDGAPLYAVNLTGLGADREAITFEIEGAEAVLCKQEKGSLLVVLDLALTNMTPEVVRFLSAHAGQPSDPIRKLAIVGISRVQKAWYRVTRHVSWPNHARFFDEHEKAKAWLVMERF
jgi:hypothetical protein